MKDGLKGWQQSIAKNSIEQYRKALGNYYIQSKPMVEVDGGKAFSLLSPPFGSRIARRRIRYIMNNTADRDMSSNNIFLNKRTPHFITVAVSYKCQCNCEHCSAQTYREDVERLQNALTLAELKDAVNQTIELGTTCVILTGGEPLLYDHLYELIESVDKTRSICTIFTNGQYLNKKTITQLKKAGVFGVFVSLDYSDPRKHDGNRKRKGIFDKAVEGIKLCQKKGILTGISTFVSKEKILNGELDAMMELGKELNVMEVFLFDIIATGKLKYDRSCMLNESEMGKIIEVRKKYNLKPDYPRIIHQTMFTSIAYPCAAEGCPAAVAQMHLRGNGDVTPCDFTPLSFGNIRSKPLKEIWQAMIQSDIYSKSSHSCRLSDPDFWSRMGCDK